MASITFDRITKRYPDGTQAVTELDLDIQDGEFLVLVGPSGCGKTTALRMAAGLEEISDGRLLIGDRVVNDVHPVAARHRDGLPELRPLPAHVGARRTWPSRCTCAGVAKAEAKARVERAAESLGLDRVPAPQAEGAVRRPAAAGGHGPGDRPQPAGVPDGRAAVQPRRQAARPDARGDPQPAARSTRTTTLYVTHDQVEAMTMGDRIAVLRKGLLQQLGTPDELYETPANLFVAEFIGSPPMNVVTAPSLRTGAGHDLVRRARSGSRSRPSALDAYPSLAGADAATVALGIRPESLLRRRDGGPVLAAAGRRRRAGREPAAGEAGPPADRRRAGRHRRHGRDRPGHRRGRRRGPARRRQGHRRPRAPDRQRRRARGHPGRVRRPAVRPALLRPVHRTGHRPRPPRLAGRSRPPERRGPRDHADRTRSSAASASTPSRRSTSCGRCRSRTASAAAGELRRAGDRDHPRAVDPGLPAPDRRVRRHLVRLDGEVRDDAGRHRPLPRHQALPGPLADAGGAGRLRSTATSTSRSGWARRSSARSSTPRRRSWRAPRRTPRRRASGCCWRCTRPSTTSTRGSCSTSRSCTGPVRRRWASCPTWARSCERFPRVVSERALRDGAKPELVDLIVQDLRRPRRHPRA